MFQIQATSYNINIKLEWQAWTGNTTADYFYNSNTPRATRNVVSCWFSTTRSTHWWQIFNILYSIYIQRSTKNNCYKNSLFIYWSLSLYIYKFVCKILCIIIFIDKFLYKILLYIHCSIICYTCNFIYNTLIILHFILSPITCNTRKMATEFNTCAICKIWLISQHYKIMIL